MLFMKKSMAFLLTLLMVAFLLPTAAFAEGEIKIISGDFTAAAWNVDGLPSKILEITINPDGRDSAGATAIGKRISQEGWDIVGVCEDFNYHDYLENAIGSDYECGTCRGGVHWLDNDTDGLNLFWNKAKDISASKEKWEAWTANHSSGWGNTGSGADDMIEKGFRYYEVSVADDIKIDVYILHMDASDDEDLNPDGTYNDLEDRKARESQLKQLADAILDSDTENPIIVMGDTNCNYMHDNVKGLFIDPIQEDPRFDCNDSWVTLKNGGEIPALNPDSNPELWEDSVDKIFYINNEGSSTELTPSEFIEIDGSTYSDHDPVVVKFHYETEKKRPEFTIPQGLTAESGKTLSTITLPDGFSWENPSENVGEAGTRSFNAIYTPDDTAKYYTVNDIKITVEVKNAADPGGDTPSGGDPGGTGGNETPVTEFTVTFDCQGHGASVESQKVKVNEKATKPADLTAEGYVFGGWFTDKDCTKEWNFDNDDVTKDITLYAKWTEEPTEIIDCQITLDPDEFAYTGKVQKPAVTVKNPSGEMMVEEADYTLVSEESKDIGAYEIAVTGIGYYQGNTTVSYKINPSSKTVKGIKSVKAGKKKMTVTWNKASKTYLKQINGYEICYATEKSFKTAKTKTVSVKSTSKTITGLKSKQKYYVKMRSYKTVGGQKYYSTWSNVKTGKTK